MATILTTPPLPDIQNAPAPPVPATLEAAGLSTDLVEQLLVKTLYTGEATGVVVADRMRLPFGMIEPLIEHARGERLVEVRGATGAGSAGGYRYTLTDAGRERGRQYLDANAYIGPAPVPLTAYVAEMKALMAARGYIDRDRLRRGFSHLII